MTTITIIKKLASKLINLDLWLAIAAGLMIFFISIAVTILVITRYILHNPINWSMPVSRFLLLYAVMLGSAYVLRVSGHVNVDIVLMHLSEKARQILQVITYMLGLVFCAVLTWQTGLLAWQSHVENWVADDIAFPLFPIYVAMPIGSFLLCLGCISKIRASVGWLRKHGQENATMGTPRL